MVIDDRIHGDNAKAARLENPFKFQQSLFLRAEHAFYFELVKKVPALTGLKRVWSESVFETLFDKTKERTDY
eukprot:evm.model.NODE_7270_length_8887_cov_28.349049.2